jgi:membrane fusion protein (multidrug efflux system)
MSQSRASSRKLVFLLLLVLVAGGEGFYWWWNARTEVYTDNAYVVGNITPIAANVTGQVVALYVDDNMIVEPGDPIAQINPVDFQIAVDQAQAEFQQATHAADAADVQTHYTTDDRRSMLMAAEAKQEEAQEAIREATVSVQTHTRLHEKEKEVLGALKAQLPGLVALERNAKDYYDRYKSLAQSGDVPGQEFDNREATYRDAVAKVQSLQSDIKGAERQVVASELLLEESRIRLEQSRKAFENTEATVGRATAEQMQLKVAADTALALRNQAGLAEAKLRQAKLDLSNTLIRAPRAGVISRRTIQIGTTVEAHEPFLSIVPLDFNNIWIVANMREKQMPNVRVGQAVKITVDAIEGKTFNGWVESVAGGSGSVFSLFPPDNATGNFVRVVQRLPVRVRFAEPENFQNRIRPGMSTRVTIDTLRYVRNSNQAW